MTNPLQNFVVYFLIFRKWWALIYNLRIQIFNASGWGKILLSRLRCAYMFWNFHSMKIYFVQLLSYSSHENLLYWNIVINLWKKCTILKKQCVIFWNNLRITSIKTICSLQLTANWSMTYIHITQVSHCKTVVSAELSYVFVYNRH